MTEQKHTPDRIRVLELMPSDPDWDAWELWPEDQGDESDDAEPVATMVCGGDKAKRLAAAWNALAGIETAEIEAGIIEEMADRLADIERLTLERPGDYWLPRDTRADIQRLLARLGRQS